MPLLYDSSPDRSTDEPCARAPFSRQLELTVNTLLSLFVPTRLLLSYLRTIGANKEGFPLCAFKLYRLADVRGTDS